MTATPSASTAGIQSCQGDRTTEAATPTSCANSPPVVLCAGGVLIRGERTLATLYRAVLALIQRRHRDGLSSHDLTELRVALYPRVHVRAAT